MLFIHILPDSPYTQRFIKFLPELGVEIEHRVLILGSGKYVSDDLNIKAKHSIDFILSTNRIKRALLLQGHCEEADAIIIHSLEDNSLLFLLLFPRFISKCCWILWGGDLYYKILKRKGLKAFIREKIREHIIPKIHHVGILIDGDYELLKNWYNFNGISHLIFYPLNEDICSLKTPKTGKTKRILIGNSADPSNNHKEILDILFRKDWRHQQVQFICPLAYGNKKYAEKISTYGENLFGEQFIAMLDFIPANDYAKFLSEIDVMIMNHVRQQAVGNMRIALAAGKKVFLRRETTPFDFFVKHRILVFDSKSIDTLSMNELFYFNPIARENNIRRIKDYFSDKNCCCLWKKLFQELVLNSQGGENIL